MEGRVDVLEKEGNEGRKEGSTRKGKKEDEKKEKQKGKGGEKEEEKKEKACRTSYLVKTASKVGPPMN